MVLLRNLKLLNRTTQLPKQKQNETVKAHSKYLRNQLDNFKTKQNMWKKLHWIEGTLSMTNVKYSAMSCHCSKNKLDSWKFKKTTFYNVMPLQQAAARVM